MMRTTLIAVLVLGLLGLAAFAGMAFYSRKAPATLGLENERLRACPQRPNCVCSEAQGTHGIEPFAAGADPGRAWEALGEVLSGAGATLIAQRPDYLHATFSSALFGFVDDFEARPAPASGVIHVRSASRAGYSDRGVNRRRVEALRAALEQRLGLD